MNKYGSICHDQASILTSASLRTEQAIYERLLGKYGHKQTQNIQNTQLVFTDDWLKSGEWG